MGKHILSNSLIFQVTNSAARTKKAHATPILKEREKSGHDKINKTLTKMHAHSKVEMKSFPNN